MTQARDFGEFDYVIAGGGTAGCVLANRLSADPDVTVLLLEAGGKDDWIWIHIPIGYLKCINNPRTDWCYKTEAEPGLNGRSIIYARGRVLGGCSSINGMLYLRGQVRDYEEWARITGDARWNWESVLPVFKRSEDYWGGADAMHGDQGEWRVEKQRLHWDILDRYTKAAQEAGIPFKADYNRGDNFGIGHFEVNQKKGVRWNASKAMLRPVLNRPNLKVVTGALIDKLVMGGKEARGVEFSLDGATHRVTARIETLLTAGAIGSPVILQRSGIGPANLLQNRGVPLLHELPGVGGNLQDHLQLRMIFKVHGITDAEPARQQPVGQGDDGPRIRAFPLGPAVDGAQPARRLFPLFARGGDTRPGIPRPAAVAGEIRRSAALFPGLHRERVQPASVLARRGAYPRPQPGDGAGHRTELPLDRERPPGRRARPAPDAQHRRPAGHGALPARGAPARRA
jgi:choline dehydrogenase